MMNAPHRVMALALAVLAPELARAQGQAPVLWGPCPDAPAVLRSFDAQERAPRRAADATRQREWEPLPPASANYTQLRAAEQQCVTFAVPLDWSAGTGESSFFARKFVGDEGAGSLVMMQGGPGSAGASLYGFAEATMAGFRQLTGRSPSVIVPDHRGAGYSNPLDCGDASAVDAAECLRVLHAQGFTDEKLRQFSVSNAAADHVHLLHNEWRPAVATSQRVVGGTLPTEGCSRAGRAPRL